MRTPNSILAGSLALALAGVAPATAGTKTTSTWTAPDLQPATYTKVAVLAKVTDDVARRILEDAVVQGLQERGIGAVAAYQVFTPADLANEEVVRAKARELGVDAGLVFTVTGESTQVKSGPSVHASVGVPVHAGAFSFFLGTSVPLGGGTSTSRKVGLKSEFHAGSGDGPRWIANYSTDLKAGSERAAEEVAAQALKQLKKSGVFSK
jgi:hypothetical protein